MGTDRNDKEMLFPSSFEDRDTQGFVHICGKIGIITVQTFLVFQVGFYSFISGMSRFRHIRRWKYHISTYRNLRVKESTTALVMNLKQSCSFAITKIGIAEDRPNLHRSIVASKGEQVRS